MQVLTKLSWSSPPRSQGVLGTGKGLCVLTDYARICSMISCDAAAYAKDLQDATTTSSGMGLTSTAGGGVGANALQHR
jgi:hypothetical protein